MTNQTALPKPRVQGFGLVRDKDGRIKADGDPNRWPAEVLAQLTAEERAYLGVRKDG